MKIFAEPAVEVVMFSVEDIITASSGNQGGGGGGQYESPEEPI